MFLISAVVVLTVFAEVCSESNNDPITSLNPDCNNAGVCLTITNIYGSFGYCDCCAPSEQDPADTCGEHWVCDKENPKPFCYAFHGDHCTHVKKYSYVSFGFRSEDTDSSSPPDVYCNTDPYEREVNNIFLYPSRSMLDQVTYVVHNIMNSNITVHETPCDTCTPAFPCTVGVFDDVNATSGYTYAFQIVLNEFYDPSCIYTGGVIRAVEQVQECAANYDFGQLAYKSYEGVIKEDSDGESIFLQNLNRLLEAAPDASNDNLGLSFTNTRMNFFSDQAPHFDAETIVFPPTESPTKSPTPLPTYIPSPSPTQYPTVMPTPVPTQSPTKMPTPEPTASPTVSPTPVPTGSPTVSPTPVPTDSPTVSPTPMPTQTPTYECGPYSNDVADLSFIGVGSNCRGGLNSSYPGNLTCASPYVICLPQENTPAALGDQDYKNSTHRYSVDECLQECANDQRCSGIEFVADSSSSLGDCNLIDDIPVVITSTVNTTFEYESTIMYTNLDNSTTGGEALCFQKEDYCNPYFEAEDLTDDMLDCYCPNNRKGFYTKKVKRSVENSRFCGNDTEVDIRIQKAQANRMFHLCENWCLFLTEDPAAESWYYDPWKACFREQYASGDDHRAYCNRVIRDPNTIEIQFIYNRVRLSCNATNGTVEGY